LIENTLGTLGVNQATRGSFCLHRKKEPPVLKVQKSSVKVDVEEGERPWDEPIQNKHQFQGF